MLRFLKDIADRVRRPGPARIVILDDIFPHPISGFRFEEYRFYLDAMPGVTVHCDGEALGIVGETRSLETLIADHAASYPRHAGRICRLMPGQVPEADAYYAIFLNNAVKYISEIERMGKPFAFTLYPGGGFRLNDAVSDDKLRRVFDSPSFRQVIVTQPCTLDYLAGKNIPSSKIIYLPGVTVPRAAFAVAGDRRRYGADKDMLDIGFVALRYTPRGEDKGYDLFIETARALCSKGVPATFHAVGPWSPDVIPLGSLADRIVFHGYLSTDELRKLARTLDVVLSPNRSNVLAPGAFDGFPTGSCAEIGLQETAMVCTDILKLNINFRDGVDIVIVEPALDDIVRKLLVAIGDPARLAQIGKNGRQRLIELLGANRQMPPRHALLKSIAHPGG